MMYLTDTQSDRGLTFYEWADACVETGVTREAYNC